MFDPGRRILVRVNRIIVLGMFGLACGGSGESLPKPSSGSAPAAKPEVADPEPALPDPAATKALADKACPRIVAPYYFRVEKAGKVSHMLGTRHMSVPFAKMPAIVKDELAKAKLVVLETVGDDDSDSATPDKPLSGLLGPKLWAKYKALVGEATATMLEGAPPATAMVSLMMLYEDATAQLDGEIEEAAKDANIELAGLETSQFQDKLLGELLDLRMLKAVLEGTPDRGMLRRESAEDIAEYCAGTGTDPGLDERTRTQLSAAGYSTAEITRLDDRLLNERNRDWLPKLETMFANGDVFVVVGADHLIGPRGVIAMLAARGFKTARVSR